MGTGRGEEAADALKAKTWVLKVSIHCPGCKTKVHKILRGIKGVYTIAIDTTQQKVTITGNVDAATLIKKLIERGKHAEIWSKKLSVKEQSEKKNRTGNKQTREHPSEKVEVKVNCLENNRPQQNTELSKSGGDSTVKSSSGEASPPLEIKVSGLETTSKSGWASKKKKMKKKIQVSNDNNGGSRRPPYGASACRESQNGDSHFNLGQPFQPSHGCQQYIPKSAIGLSYSASHAPFCCVPQPPPYRDYNQQGSYCVQRKPPNYFEIFSDENANGCSIM